MKIMLAKPVATEKTHRPLQNRLRPTEAIALAIKRFQPINMARCLESTRPFKASFYSEEFRTGVRDRSLDHTRPLALAGSEDSQDRTSGSGVFRTGRPEGRGFKSHRSRYRSKTASLWRSLV